MITTTATIKKQRNNVNKRQKTREANNPRSYKRHQRGYRIYSRANLKWS